MEGIMSGTAITDIELPVGMPMTGYFSRKYRSAGIHDQLKIRSVVFDDGKHRFLLVVCDLLGLSSSFIKETSMLVEKQIGISSENIVIACIHTHSGPASIFLQDCGEIDEQWLLRLRTGILDCVKKAIEKTKLSLMHYSIGTCDIGLNRVAHENRAALIDNKVGILEIKDVVNGKKDTVIVNFACHPVVLGGDNLLYSKDYPNYTEEYLKKKFGPDINVIFVTGCCGDIDPVERGDFKTAANIGSKLGESIVENSTLIIGESDFKNGGMYIASLNIEIPLSYELDESTAYDLIKNYKEEAERLAENGENEKARLSSVYAKWAYNIYERIKNNTLYNSFNADIKLIRIGKLVIVALPFEVFHEIGLKIKKLFGVNNTIIVCYANGDYGYVPSKSLYSIAGYEAGSAHKFYGHPGPVRMDAEDILLDTLKNINGGI